MSHAVTRFAKPCGSCGQHADVVAKLAFSGSCLCEPCARLLLGKFQKNRKLIERYRQAKQEGRPWPTRRSASRSKRSARRARLSS